MNSDLKTYTLDGLKACMQEHGLDAYRGEQIFKWIWQKNVRDFEPMTNISKSLREELSEHFVISTFIIKKIIKSDDRTHKFLFQLNDGLYIESVFIPEERRTTICVSTQVGCPLNCLFCATGLMGFKRDLQAFEIAEQVRIIQEYMKTKVTNVVFMGMGEPLLNVENVCNAIDILCSPMGLSISQRHMTVSTIGLINGIKHLYDSPYKIKLAISLNFPQQTQRESMMPGTRNNPLNEILKLASHYSKKKTMVTFEYVIIKSINDRVEDARKLRSLIKDIPSKVNLIPYNPHPALPYKAPTEQALSRFHACMLESPHTITLRRSRGPDICAACGQLSILDFRSRI